MIDLVEKWAKVGGFLALLVGALWFCVHEDQRIYKLETQVQTLSVAPLVSQQSPSGHQGLPRIVENPLLAECADLAKRSADAIRDGKIRSVLCKEFTPVSPGQHLFILEPAS